jgi:hypothetical protein
VDAGSPERRRQAITGPLAETRPNRMITTPMIRVAVEEPTIKRTSPTSIWATATKPVNARTVSSAMP